MKINFDMIMTVFFIGLVSFLGYQFFLLLQYHLKEELWCKDRLVRACEKNYDQVCLVAVHTGNNCSLLRVKTGELYEERKD